MATATPRTIKRLICKTSEVAPQTLDRFLDGRPVRPQSRRRIARAMQQLGIELEIIAPSRRVEGPQQ